MFPRGGRQTHEVQSRKKKTSKDKAMNCKDCMKNRINFSDELKAKRMKGHRQRKFQARRKETIITNTKTKIKRDIPTSIAKSTIKAFESKNTLDEISNTTQWQVSESKGKAQNLKYESNMNTMAYQENKCHHMQKEKLVSRNNVKLLNDSKTFQYTAGINQLQQQCEPTIAKTKCVKDDNMIAQHDAISHIQSECPKWITDVQRSRDHTSMAISKQIQFVPDIESKVWNDHIDSTESPQSSQYQTGNHIQLKKSHSSTNISLRYTAASDTIDLKSRPNFKISAKSDPKCDKKTHVKENILKDVINGAMSELDTKVRITVAPVSRHENEVERSQEDQSEPTRSEIDRGEIIEACSPEVRTHVDLAIVQNQKHLPVDLPESESERALQDCAIGGQVVMDGGSSYEMSIKCPCDIVHPKTLHCKYSAMSTHTQNDNCSEVTNRTEASCPTLQIPMQPSNLPDPEVNQADLPRFEPLIHIIDKIAGGERVPPQITMRYELLRFCTLRSFPKHNKPYITRIAQAGFYFANTDDEVVCYCCARRKSNWREDDIPIEIHRELNPNCSFLLSNLEVNVPVRMSELLIQESNRSTSSQILENTNQTSSASTSDTISCNTSGPTNHSSTTANSSTPNVTQAISSPVVSTNSELSQNRVQPRAHGNFVMTSSASSFVQEHQSNSVTASNGIHASPVVSSSSLRPTSELSAQGTDTSATPKYPKYASKTARVTSYNDCGDIVIPPDSLATSGFFYAGFGDCVRCFQCGVGLRHWSEEDDPWIEHSRWSKDCLFVKQVRGQEFVNIVQMAVQYSQNQNGNDQTPVGSPTGSSSDADLERQMHTDAAQSVLEMGYTPHVIRSALRALRDGNDGRTLNATILMEKIVELEDEASANDENNQPVQGTPPNQSNAIAQAPVTINNNTQSQRVLIDTGSASSNSARTQSAPVGDKSSQASLTTNASSEATRPQNKKSQLLEQKKLKQENEQMKQQSLCTKCKQNDVCIVFLPCGHLVTCETCAPAIRYCSVEGCGKYIKGTVRTYLA